MKARSGATATIRFFRRGAHFLPPEPLETSGMPSDDSFARCAVCPDVCLPQP